ncbi:hypothetical protein ACPDZI_07885 [Aeromonas oralensis]|uniref:GAP1-N1 domain-containing protein n=1 Tax=Aeromonas oralensis TaxID=3415010 RepID=UPI003F691838
MTFIDVQIHGYRKGHQLLASSIELSKDDQAVVDRLSDIAGPLRPKELIEPYLSMYPLPSGSYYVVAKTWQDLSVSRAGCVRTKSLILDTQLWSQSSHPFAFLRLLSSPQLPNEMDATRIQLEATLEVCLPTAPKFNVNEMMEALFLEEPKPVVVFDAPEPEVIALHLITSLWPDMRRRFALSTFALSPRKIGGRDLDLVFAPSSVRAKFSDWPGRRVEGRLSQIERHRWTRTIVNRSFEGQVPRLLSDSEITLLGNRKLDSAVALRIALLWEELFEKLNQTPTAALGLLDIANSGMVNRVEALKLLEPRLIESMGMAERFLLPIDAWEFVGAITRKMQAHSMPAIKIAVEKLVIYLSEKAPDGILGLLQQGDRDRVIDSLIPSIAIGLGNGVLTSVKSALIQLPTDVIVCLVSQGGSLTRYVAGDDELIETIGAALFEVDRELADKAGMMLLPFIVEDRQLPAAVPIFGKLGIQDVAIQLHRLRDANDFQATRLSRMLIDRAREVGGLQLVRDTLILSSVSARSAKLLALTIEPVIDDVLWLLGETGLPKSVSTELLIDVLRRADERQFTTLLSNRDISNRVLSAVPDDNFDIFTRAILQESLPINEHVRLIKAVLPKLDDKSKLEISGCVLGRFLRNRFDGDEAEILFMLFDILGAQLNGAWVVREGLNCNINKEVVSRNLILFDKAPLTARHIIITAADDIARVLKERLVLDLTEKAYDACARLMLEAETVVPRTILVDAASQLLPSLLRARDQPVSLLISALFPIIYQELATSHEVPELMRFFYFFDWDRCKTARNELVNAFMSSSYWKPGHLALTAFRCHDTVKIFKQIANTYNGDKYLVKIEGDLENFNEEEKVFIKNLINELLAEKLSKKY